MAWKKGALAQTLMAPVAGRIAGKIVLPYLLLILVLALLATYLVVRTISASLEERFGNALLDAGNAANESMVKLEDEHLQALRLMSNAVGVAEAIEAGDHAALERLLPPLQMNAGVELVDVVRPDGALLLSLRGETLRERTVQGLPVVDGALGRTSLAQRALTGAADALGDKHADILRTVWGDTFYVAGPVRRGGTGDAQDEIVGALLLGMPLDRALGRLATDAQASLTLYSADGAVRLTTLPLVDSAVFDESSQARQAAPVTQTGQAGVTGQGASGGKISLGLAEAQATQVLSPSPVLVRRPITLGTRPYQELIGALEIRGRAVAPLGVAVRIGAIQQAAFSSSAQLVVLFGAVALGVLGMGFGLARAITRPLTALVGATDRVSQGDLSAELRVTSTDETGRLTHSFNQMVSGLRDREKIRNMFSQYVTNQVVDAVMRGEVHLGGDTREVAILLTDVRSFTTLSESLTPTELVTMINRYFSEMIEAIMEFEGTLDKFIGDGILVEYNAPLDQERYALRAVLTALRMRERLVTFNEAQEARGEQTIRIGMGIHCGSAVVGNIGAEGKRVEYTAMGDTVNVAARLESQTKELQADLLISAQTYELVAPWVTVGRAVSLHVKGRSEAVVAHRVTGLRDGLTLGIHLLTEPVPSIVPALTLVDGGFDGVFGPEMAADEGDREVIRDGAETGRVLAFPTPASLEGAPRAA